MDPGEVPSPSFGGSMSKLLSVYLEHEEEINRYADAGERLPAFVRKKALEELQSMVPSAGRESLNTSNGGFYHDRKGH